jgi:hypothetical protein
MRLRVCSSRVDSWLFDRRNESIKVWALPVELRLINGDFSPVHPLIGTLAAVGIDLVKHGVFRVRVRWAAMA